MLTIIVGNVVSQIKSSTAEGQGEADEAVKILKQYLRFENDYFARQDAGRRGYHLPKYTYLVSERGRNHGKFPTGLLNLAERALTHHGVSYVLKDQLTPVPFPTEDEIHDALDGLSLTPRPYQEQAIFQGVLNKRGMFDLCTGSGKTLCLSALTAIWNQKTLVVCDKSDLAMQLRSEISSILGEPVGLIGASGSLEIERVTVGMVQSLNSKKELKPFFDSIHHLIFDEVHHTQAPSWREVSKRCKNAPLRHGFSGTCFSSEAVLESGERVQNRNLLLLAHTGKIIAQVKSKDLIEMGYLSKPRITFVKNTVYNDGVQLTPEGREYQRIIVQDQNRNNIAADFVRSAYDTEKQCVVFVKRIEHGEIFADLLLQKGIPQEHVVFIHGSEERSVRDKVLCNFREGRLPVLVGTVLNEGLDMFAECGVNLAGGRSSKNTIQRLGRLLRKPKTDSGDVDTETVRTVSYLEFMDRGHPYYYRQADARFETYTNEGHDIRVVRYNEGSLVNSQYEVLPIKGKNLATIYSAYAKAYQAAVGKWEWGKGEKQRIKATFVLCAEALGARDEASFGDVLDKFSEYIEKSLQDFLGWDKANRNNVLGYLYNIERVQMFFAKLNHTESKPVIAGQQSNSEWDF